ncbi:MAG: flagellar hook-associated protein FlgL [Desulfobacterales bacterium]|nr:MAG: flagellar hook-associated protein FlgL [Desulfobacterales bacterium]
MRVTHNMMTNSVIIQLHRQSKQLLETQNEISTEKRINKPSDDPIGASQVLRYRRAIASVEQYQTNIDRGKTRIELNELTLGMVDDLLLRARELARANTASDVSPEARQIAAEEVKDLYEHIMQSANAKDGDNYLFSGHQTATAPFSRDADYNATYHGDDGTVRVIIGENVEVSIDADGRNIFQNAANGGVNVFDALKDLIDGLENADLVAGRAQIRAAIQPLDDAHRQVNYKRSEYGPKLYRFEVAENHWFNFKPRVEMALSEIEQADIAKAIVDLKNIELAYETTVATAARIIQPGLINFLK